MTAIEHLSRAQFMSMPVPGESDIAEHMEKATRGGFSDRPRVTALYGPEELKSWGDLEDFRGSTHAAIIDNEREDEEGRYRAIHSTYMHHPEHGWRYAGGGSHSGPKRPPGGPAWREA